jgi:hypothetical protein
MSVLEEIQRRKVFRVAGVYVLVAWGVLQVIDVVGDPLNLPDWFATVTILLLAVGFPLVVILAWVFDIGPGGVTKTATREAPALASGRHTELVLLAVLVLGIGWLVIRDMGETLATGSAPIGTPVVVLMDTFAARGVYDEETRRNSGTNADVLSDILQDMPVLTQKEPIGSVWDREVQILRQNPALIFIHRSAFFHSMNAELGFGYPEPGQAPSEKWTRLYAIAEGKLIAFMGFIATQNPTTQFVVYSRGTGGAWAEQSYRDSWLQGVEGRFPALAGRVTAVQVPGGLGAGSFKSSEGRALARDLTRTLLQLEFEQPAGS